MGKNIWGGRHYVSKRIEDGNYRAGMGNVLLLLKQRGSEIWHRKLRLDN